MSAKHKFSGIHEHVWCFAVSTAVHTALMLLCCCLNTAKTSRLAFHTAASLEKQNAGKSLAKTFSLKLEKCVSDCFEFLSVVKLADVQKSHKG